MGFFKKKEAEINALEQFLSSEPDLSGLEENISKGIIELRYNQHHSSSGLLITTDGYFLTAMHCVRKIPESIRLYNGREYGITKVCTTGKKEDIALVKADIPGKCSHLSYKFSSEIHEKDVVAMLTRREGKLKYKYGFVFSEYNIAMTKTRDGKVYMYPNQFVVRIEGVPGDSGGLVLDKQKRILGITSGGYGDEFLEVASIVKIDDALKLVEFYKERLKKRI